MCKAIEDMKMDAKIEGREEGREESIISSIKNLMQSMKWTAKQAMDALLIPVDDQPRYAKML